MAAVFARTHLIVAVAIALAGVAILLWLRHSMRAASHEEQPAPHRWHPYLCPHEWETEGADTCENTYSSYGGGVELQQWVAERCKLCGSRRFRCSDPSCPSYDDCRQLREADTTDHGELERQPLEKVADKHGFEYARCLLRDRYGNERTEYRLVIPTTYAFTCPDCGGMVVGVDAKRVWALGKGPFPTAFRCEDCGRQESYDFGVPRVEEREGEPSFVAPEGMQPVCPQGGRHEWELIDTWTSEEMPEGVDPCLENLSLLEEVTHERWRCSKCGEERID